MMGIAQTFAGIRTSERRRNIGTGLSPLEQWIAIPLAAFWRARRMNAESFVPIGRKS